MLGGDSTNCSDIYEVDLEILKIYEEGGGGSTGGGGEKVKVSEIQFDNNCVDEDGKIYADNIDTSLLTTMYGMFYGCSSLVELDLSGWDTSKVINMSGMFQNCSNLQTVGDISNWNTSINTNMYCMFYKCSSLTELDLSGWDTSNVSNMNNLFDTCNKLVSVGDISNWNISKVTSLYNVFNKCSSLTELDLSGWDTSNVTNVATMFYNCEKLQKLDLSGWNGSNVTNIGNFSYSSPILTYVGGKTIDEVINNNITIFNGIKKSRLNILQQTADRASARALINGLADMTGGTAYVLELYSDFENKITTEDIAVATAKNWTISFLY